jgi:hypothetical protein
LNRIYTLGYAHAEVTELVSLARDGALIVDIRYHPTSRWPQWRQGALRQVLSGAYSHERWLGNVNYRGGGSQVANGRRAPLYGRGTTRREDTPMRRGIANQTNDAREGRSRFWRRT